MNTDAIVPRRGEVWLVELEPTRGAEIRKKRPAIVINADAIGRLRIKLIAPITEWKPEFSRNVWHVQLEPNDRNGLRKLSAIDTLQLRGIDIERFDVRLGTVSDSDMEGIVTAIATVIGYQ